MNADHYPLLRRVDEVIATQGLDLGKVERLSDPEEKDTGAASPEPAVRRSISSSIMGRVTELSMFSSAPAKSTLDLF